MSYQCLIQPTLRAFQAGKLLTVAKHCFDRPASPFALHHGRQLRVQRVRHQILPEIIVGCGAFIGGFALFGYDLKDYDALFAEKLGLLMALNTSARVTWSGKFRPPLRDAVVMSRPFQERLPLWVGALSPQSVVRTASLGLPLALPMLGDSLPGYAQTAALYSEAWQAAGYDPNDARISVFSHMHVAETTQAARAEFLPADAAYMHACDHAAPSRARGSTRGD